MDKNRFGTVDEYMAAFPKDVQVTLEEIRRTIQKAVPNAEERISYGMPAFKFHGWLLYYAAFKDHCSLFGAGPVQGLRKAFKEELAPYQGSKGTIRFPLDEHVPLKLIRDIAKFRAKENLEREKMKN